jgi:hypothetical protein
MIYYNILQLMLLPPYEVQILSLAACSQTLSIFVLHLM